MTIRIKKTLALVLSLIFIVQIFSTNLTAIALGERAAPYSAYQNNRFVFQRYSADKAKTVELQLLELTVGDEANAIVADESSANKVPASDEQWVLFKLNLKYVSGPEEELRAGDVFYNNQFSSDFYFSNSYVGLTPIDTGYFSKNLKDKDTDTKIYPGGNTVFYAAALFKKTVGNPMFRIRHADNTYSWFSTIASYVQPVAATGVKIYKGKKAVTSITVKKGKKQQLSVVVSPKKATQYVNWTSSNQYIASVSSSGKITAKGKGTVTITAKTQDGKQAKCKVKVVVPVKSVYIASSLYIKKGKSYKPYVSVSPYDANNKKVTFSSSNKKIATVNKKGKIKGIRKGTCRITVKSKDGGKKKKCKVIIY